MPTLKSAFIQSKLNSKWGIHCMFLLLLCQHYTLLLNNTIIIILDLSFDVVYWRRRTMSFSSQFLNNHVSYLGVLKFFKYLFLCDRAEEFVLHEGNWSCERDRRDILDHFHTPYLMLDSYYSQLSLDTQINIRLLKNLFHILLFNLDSWIRSNAYLF